MLPLQGSLLQVWPNGQDLAHLPASSPKQVLGRGSMPEFKEQKERKAMEQTVPQAWLLLISDLSAQRRDCSPSVILPRASEIIVMWGSGFCRLPRSPSSEVAVSAHLPYSCSL